MSKPSYMKVFLCYSNYMNNIKIAFFDIDGTILSHSTRIISDQTVNTLHALQNKGIKIVIATGRAPLELPDFRGVDFDAYLLFNGSYCFDSTGTIYSKPMDKDDIKIVTENAIKMHKAVMVSGKNSLSAYSLDEEMIEYEMFANIMPSVDPNYMNVIANEDIYQMMVTCKEGEYEEIIKGTKHTKIAPWWPKVTDVFSSDNDKGAAIKNILKHYGISKDEAMAFGDGGNDFEMLQEVKYGIAMGNGSEKLKAIAYDVCGHIDDEGLTKYCIQNNLI